MGTVSGSSLERFVATGDSHAFGELVREYQGMVYATCVGVLERPSADVDDAVQETFLKLSRSAGTIHGNVAAWLHACARTTALDCYRRARVRDRHERAVPGAAADVSGPGERHETEEIRRVVGECVDELPSRDREVVVRYWFIGQTQQQIADVLGVSQVAVQRRLTGALEVLRRRCVQRGVAVAALMAMLGAPAAGAMVPPALADRLAQLAPPRPVGWSGTALAIGGGALVLAATIAVLALTLFAGGGDDQVGSTRSVDAAATAAPVAAAGGATVPLAPVVARAAVAPAAEPTAVAKPAADTPPDATRSLAAEAWKFTQLTARTERVTLDGEEVDALRLTSQTGTLVGLATTAVTLPADGYVVEFDYRTLRVGCPFTSVNAEPAYGGIDSLVKPLREVDSGDGQRSPKDRWRRYRAEVRAVDVRIRVTIFIDGEPHRRFTVPAPGAALQQLHLRVVDGDMQVARLRVLPLPLPAGADF